MVEMQEYKICQIGEVVTGKTPSSAFPEEFGSDMLFITPTDYKNYRKWAKSSERMLSNAGVEKLKNKVLPEKSVLVTCIGSDMGKVVLNKVKAITNQQINAIIPDETIVNSEYLYYKLIDSYPILRMYGQDGTAVPILNKGDFEQLVLEIPKDVNVQEGIATVLTSIDDKIEFLFKQNETFEELVAVLFEHVFISQQERLKNNRLGTLVETTLGGEWGKEEEEEDFNQKVQCIRGTDIADLNVGLANRMPIRFIKEKKLQAIEPHDGDLIIEISGGSDGQSTGRTIYINNDIKALFDYPLVFSNFCRLIRPKKKEYMFFLYSYIQHLYNQGDFFNLENGSSGIRNFDYKAFLFELEYPMPEEDEILRYEKDVEPYFKKINANKLQIKSLERLRDTLLPKLMSGEIRVG